MRGKKIVQLCIQNNLDNGEKIFHISTHIKVPIETAETNQNFVNSFETTKQINIPDSEVQSIDDIFTAWCEVPDKTVKNNDTISTVNNDDFTVLSYCTNDNETNINNDILFSLNSSNTLVATTNWWRIE